MNKSLLYEILFKAKKMGAIYSDIFIEDKHKYSGVISNGNIENTLYGAETGIVIRLIFNDGSNINIITNNLTDKNLRNISSELINLSYNKTLHINNSQPQSIDLLIKNENWSNKLETLKRINYNEITKRIYTLIKRYDLEERKIIVMNSEGMYVEDIQVKNNLEISMSILDGKGKIHEDNEFISLSGNEGINKQVIKKIIKSLYGTIQYKIKPKEEKVNISNIPIVVHKGEGGIIIHEACGHAFELDNIKNGSFISTINKGERIIPTQITLIDDPTMVGLAGSFNIDDEGQIGRKKLLVDSGVIQPTSYLSNLESLQFNLDLATGNGRRSSYETNPLPRMSNFHLKPGDFSDKQIIGTVPYGLFIKKLGGGQVNSISGEFSYSVKEAYLIENGKVTYPIKPSSFMGKSKGLLNQIEMVGNDLEFKSVTCLKKGQLISCSAGTPTFIINKLG